MTRKEQDTTKNIGERYEEWKVRRLLTAPSALSRVPNDIFEKSDWQEQHAQIYGLLTKTLSTLTTLHASVAASLGRDARRPAWIIRANLDELMPAKVFSQCVSWLSDLERKQSTEYRHTAGKIQQLAAHAMAIMLLIKQEYFQTTQQSKTLFFTLLETASPVAIAAIAKQVADLAPNSPALLEQAGFGALVTDLITSENKLSTGFTPSPDSYRGRRIAHRMFDTDLLRRLMTSENAPFVVKNIDALVEVYAEDESRKRLLDDSSAEGNLAQISWLIRQRQLRTLPEVAFAQQALCRAVVKGVESDNGTHVDLYLSLWNSFATEDEKKEVFRQDYSKLLGYLLTNLPNVRSIDDVRLFFTHQYEFEKTKPLLEMSSEVLIYCITRFQSVPSSAYRPYALEIVRYILSDAELSEKHLPSLQQMNPVLLHLVLYRSELGSDVPTSALPALAGHLATGERFHEAMKRQYQESGAMIEKLDELLKKLFEEGDYTAVSIIWQALSTTLKQVGDQADEEAES